MPHRYFVHLAYRGTHYRGWQRQSGNTVSVQETIERAVTQVHSSPVKAVGCGRTDAGVHASDYYLHFDSEQPLRDNWLFIVNKLLPNDIVLYRVWEVDSSAHVRYDARERTYDYFIHTRADPFLAPLSSLYEMECYDFAAMHRACSLLTGRHDFRAFCLTPDRHNTTTCDLREASLHDEGQGRYRFRFVADRFLRGMIRILVFQLLRVGAGKIAPEDMQAALRSGQRLGVGQARPEGLFLSKVEY
ncbi:tRNA pseudouridine38-40 synthase [Lewinella aquimaris]|uniref:tRNA pseudouridine synthase A n=1 Tax=Neolewinella aquimaris TaxID=1835722 RepID=A0A840E4M8_9BACT|nr:tRNA pseudouridine(38-40) synthase TruA [Neolewinella aquimaris]MBB4078913.1 tRNA pseudouridine38-40 synthase [Neolewinella aquimaris]